MASQDVPTQSCQHMVLPLHAALAQQQQIYPWTTHRQFSHAAKCLLFNAQPRGMCVCSCHDAMCSPWCFASLCVPCVCAHRRWREKKEMTPEQDVIQQSHGEKGLKVTATQIAEGISRLGQHDPRWDLAKTLGFTN